MAIATWMAQLKVVMEGVSGISQVHNYDELPGSLMAFPCVVMVPTGGSQEYSTSGPAVAVTDVQITLYVAAQVLPEAYGLAVPFIGLVRDALAAHVQLHNTVSYIMPAERKFYDGPGAIKYGDKEHVGINFYVQVKEIEAVTVTA